MSQQRFSAEGEVLATRGGKGDAAKEWISLLLPPLAIVGTLVAFWLIWQAALTPMRPVSDSPMQSAGASFGSPSAATFPPELLSMAVAISTFIAPTPTRTPTPLTPTPDATAPPPALICGQGVTEGTTCEWGGYTPTPEPTIGPCLTPMPGFSCVWVGSMAGTPVAIGGAGKGT